MEKVSPGAYVRNFTVFFFIHFPCNLKFLKCQIQLAVLLILFSLWTLRGFVRKVCCYVFFIFCFFLQELRTSAIAKPLELNELENGIKKSVISVQVIKQCLKKVYIKLLMAIVCININPAAIFALGL